MKRIWPFIYAVSAPLCVYGGFLGSRHEVNDSDAGWVMIAFVFVMFSILPLGWFGYAILHSKKSTMPRPSFDRHPFGWWSDVLQALRVSVLLTVLKTVGVLIAFGAGRGQSDITVCMWVALSAGIVIGERLVYRIYKARIAPHPEACAQAATLSEY